MNEKKFNRKKTYIYAAGLIIVLIFVFSIFYKENQSGTLQIKSSDKNLIIFIDNQKETTSQGTNQKFKLKNDEHTVIISKEKCWPWVKKIEIKQKDNLVIQPFFIPKNTSGLLINKKDSEYQNIISLFQKNLFTAQAMKEISNSSINLKAPIRAIDFYKDRQDVVIIASGDKVYALETNTKNIQNFQPIYKGKKPVFIKKDNFSLYILDNDNLMLVNY